MPRRIIGMRRHHTPSAFNHKVSQEYHRIKMSHPGMDHRSIFAAASKAAAGKHAGSGFYINPFHGGTGVRRSKIGYY